jgi:hypothetical protein
MNVAHTVLALSIEWDPGVRGVLVISTGIAVLIGSVYLVLGTNLGSRLGFLVAIAGLSGWMALMGFVWCMYGIGYKGTAAHYKVEEVVTSESKDDLRAAKLEKAHDLSEWQEVPSDDPARGESQAAATAALTTKGSRVKLFDSEAEFKVVDVYTRGGKKVSHGIKWSKPLGDEGLSGFLNAWLPGPHPPRYTIVQVQAVKQVEVPLGQKPPTAKVDESAPVESVILVRDLGKLRVPSFLVMLASLIVFGVTCSTLHRRDKVLMAARAAAAAAG